MNYQKFLETKKKRIINSGFIAGKLNKNLFEFQEYIVKKALEAGKYAVFADCGLGKTIIQLEWANQVSNYTGKPVLILAPLAVSGQTIQKGKEGYIGIRDFSGMLIHSFLESGFVYHSRVTIWKDPVVEMQRTKALGLLHKQVKKDATRCRVGLPDYLLIFRKDGEAESPVNCDIPVDLWQKYASPVWMDINYSDTLQFRTAREVKDEKHICPLQLPTIERAIHLYTNKGDTVLSPFAGIGSEIYQAVKMERHRI